jgi:D-beta-D-heptose 7-phosphate kinase/D-beta-D-heptose 1-phosphate adenosyltransferase
LLEYAKSLGHHLTVGLDEDQRVRKSKGKHRPILPLKERKKIISSLACVDEVCSFGDELELEHEIYRRNIDIMVVGDDYKDKPVIGSNFANNVKYFKKIDGKSTTDVIGRILQEYCKERFHG